MSQVINRPNIPTIVCPVWIGEDLNLRFKREVTLTTSTGTSTYNLNASELSCEDETNAIVWNQSNNHITQDATHITIFCAEADLRLLNIGIYKFVLFREAVSAQKTAMMNITLDLK